MLRGPSGEPLISGIVLNALWCKEYWNTRNELLAKGSGGTGAPLVQGSFQLSACTCMELPCGLPLGSSSVFGDSSCLRWDVFKGSLIPL